MRRSSLATAVIALLAFHGAALAADPAPAANTVSETAAPAAAKTPAAPAQAAPAKPAAAKSAAPKTSDEALVKALPKEDVINYVEELMRWQKDAAAIDTTSATTREILLQDNLQQNTLKILRSGFKAAKIEASFTPATDADADTDAEPDEPKPTPAQRMRQHADETDKQVQQLQQQIEQAKSATARDQLQGRLKLAVAKQQLYASVLANISASSSSNGFAGQLSKLEQSVPDLNEATKSTGTKTTPAAPAATTTTNADGTTTTTTPRPVTSVFTLASDMFDTLRQQRELRSFADETAHLEETSRNLIKPLRTALDDIGATATSASVDEQVAAFNRIGSVMIPLGDATFGITASKSILADWQGLLDARLKHTFRLFLIKLAILAVTLAIPIIIGDFAKGAIKKYVRDPKRQRQANIARRIIVGIVLLLILLFNFISDFSSFATFAGFMTAGLAVALQGVLLSLVAHFFFYGRYGVRAGDRVSVGDVTGDILQVGMMRFYLRQLEKGEDGQLQYTGKVVAFPNSILFQPAGFYKYVPDATSR